MTFQEAEQQYATLVQQWQAGQLTSQQFNDAVAALRIQASDGNWWSIRAQDGAWLWWNGATWQEATPPHRTAASAVTQLPQKRSRRRWLITCFVLLLVSVCCLALVGGGGYLAVQAGSMSLIQLSTQLEGAGEVSIVNTSDEELSVRLVRLDDEAGEVSMWNDSIAPFDIGGYGGSPAGYYRLEFAGEGALNASCTFQLERGDSYQFVAVPEGIAVVRDGHTAQDGAELDVAISSLCRQ